MIGGQSVGRRAGLRSTIDPVRGLSLRGRTLLAPETGQYRETEGVAEALGSLFAVNDGRHAFAVADDLGGGYSRRLT